MYANWRYPAAQEALIQLATDLSADPFDRLNATDAIGYAVRFQVKGVRQDPQMFRALVSLLTDKVEPVRSTAAGVLMPAYETAVEGPGRRRAPEGGWEKWLDEITAHTMPAPDRTADPAAKFQQTLKSAEGGSVPAQAALGMMYATGKGVQQNYGEAFKWWVKAGEGGDLVAARFAWQNRSTQGVQRNPEVVAQLAKMLGEAVPVPRTAAAPAGAPAPARQQ